MRKIIYLCICVTLLGCKKTLSIDYQDVQPIDKKPDSFFVGTWDGLMECPSCCSAKYHYTLTITKQENSLLEGSLKIADIPEQQYYVIFNLEMTFKNNTLTVKTKGKTEEMASKPGCEDYCDDNLYVLNLSSDKRSLTGNWISSECSSIVGQNATTINIQKQ